jgi:hypothetical protein
MTSAAPVIAAPVIAAREMSPLEQQWRAWHKENPHVYRLFNRFTREAISRGHQRLSAWLIINRVRWETAIVTTGNDFKISNDYIAYYSREFMRLNPQYDGFFVIKAMKR